MAPIEAILIGAGQRGRFAAGAFAERHPAELRFVAVAEPDDDRRRLFAQAHAIAPERQFRSWEELLAGPRLAPLCFNMTMDRTHLESALAAIERGYDMLLEKPMADSPAACLRIVEAARARGRMVQVCHPLRFNTFYGKVKALLEEGAIGRITSLTLHENVGSWHFAHSYVRGNWRREDECGPMILTKCCHDMDLATWLVGSRVRSVASFGGRALFRAENAPGGAARRCTDNCAVASTCPFYAPAYYLGAGIEWGVTKQSVATTPEERMEALRTGPYGRCVYHCDNTVVDHQVVAAEFENGVTLDFAVRGNTFDCYRTIRIVGTEGEINGHLEKNWISTVRFGQDVGAAEAHRHFRPEILPGGHGGGDTGVIRNLLRKFAEDARGEMMESLELAAEGHLLSFAAEEARRRGEVVDMEEFRAGQGRAGENTMRSA